jgi:hypothetical protein
LSIRKWHQQEKEIRQACTFSSGRDYVEPFSHGLLSLKVLLFESAKSFSAFFALATAILCNLSAYALAVVAESYAFCEAMSSASSDAMRAFADARASIIQQIEKREVKQIEGKTYKASRNKAKS